MAARPAPIINLPKLGHIDPEDRFPHPDDRETFIRYLIRLSRTHPPSYVLFQASIHGVVDDILKHEETAHLATYYPLMEVADKLIQVDDKEAFALFLTNYKDLIHKLPPDFLLFLICTHPAPRCAAVFFESGGFHVDISKDLLGYYSPLEYAAVHFSYDLTRILFDYGIDNSDPSAPFGHIELAVGKALKQLRCYPYFSDWNKRKSIFKLFYIMCIPDLKEPLDTIGLLASRSNNIKKVLDVALKSDITLVALLMAAPDKFLKPFPDGKLLEVVPDDDFLGAALYGFKKPSSLGSDDILWTTPFGQYFLKELAVLVSLQENELDEDRRNFSWVQMLIDAYDVAKTLSCAIGVLENYRNSPRVKIVPKHEIPFDIAVDIINDNPNEEVEYELMLLPQDVYCDDIECLRPKLTSNVEGANIDAKDIAEKICFSQPWIQKTDLHPPFKVEKPAVGASWFSSPAVLCAPYRKFHSCSAIEIKPPKTVQMKPSLCNVSSLSRICVPLIQIVKRMK